ncbi:uncharacterized protein LOC127287065 [Leptopilina boulardi]|uniref:uncharacterized protein LOC127287065 n=1 Tax=Leptopilina boulardi TaxID=63433 RepID=UPI0021F58E7D|nr:uncharacterized protein LOC127287065 [Leptopilina boulardi]
MMKFVVVLSLAAATFAAPASQEVQQRSLFEEAIDVYSSCADENDMAVCLKLKALNFVDRAARSAEFDITDDLKIVQTDEAKNSRADYGRSLNEIESSLPTEIEAREAAVDKALFDRTAKFLSTHTVELNLGDESSRSLEEGRGKKKKIVKSLIPLLLLLKLKFAALIPIAIGVLAFLALKALVFGKIALVISAILGLQKLMGAKHQTYEVPHHEEHHEHGWGRSANSWEQASDLAYNAYQPTN